MNYRCYHLNNMYLAAVHAGLQSAHAQHELAIKYLDSSESLAETPIHEPAKAGYLEWAKNHKTIIVLNGGMQSNLLEWETMLASAPHPYAWASFRESEEALNGALTNIALVLPEKIYSYAKEVTRADNAPMGVCAVVRRLEDNAECRYKRISNGGAKLYAPDGDELVFSEFELDLMAKLSRCGLM